jgi:hypothetical protein
MAGQHQERNKHRSVLRSKICAGCQLLLLTADADEMPCVGLLSLHLACMIVFWSGLHFASHALRRVPLALNNES